MSSVTPHAAQTLTLVPHVHAITRISRYIRYTSLIPPRGTLDTSAYGALGAGRVRYVLCILDVSPISDE